MRNSYTLFVAALLASLLPILSMADEQPSVQTVINAVFTTVERDTIRQYFQQHPDQLQALNQVDAYANSDDMHAEHEDNGPGDEHERDDSHGHNHGHGWKSQPGGLPPGIAKNLARGMRLPPGIQKQIQPLPRALQHELPPAPRGYERVMVNGEVLLVDMASQVIHDVISDAANGNNSHHKH